MSHFSTGGSRSGQISPQLSPIQSHSGMQPPHRGGRRDGPAKPTISLPPLRQYSTTPPTPSDRRHGNVLGVQSILNPEVVLIEQQRSRRRSASQMDSRSPTDSHHPQSLPSISRPPSVDFTRGDLSLPKHRSTARHQPTPLSPRTHRTKGLGQPTGTIDAHRTPFLSASVRPSDPVTSQAPLPTPPAVSRGAYFSTGPPMAPTPPPHTTRTDMPRPSASYSQSGSASPITHYSPYSRSASVTSGYENHGSQGHYTPSSSQIRDGQTSAIEHNMIPMAPNGQSSIQLMTIKSHHGHPVQIPVDVQAASKVADEKRRRNAGASARFRARRKEKEREASISISRLEQQLRNALEDTEFYRGERDYFKSVVYQQPGTERHCARPQSPRLRRLSISHSHPTSPTTADGSEASYDMYEDEEHDSDRNVRRRTSSYHPASGPPPTAFNNHAHVHESYPTSGFASASHAAYQQTSPQDQGRVTPTKRPIYCNSFGADAGHSHNRI